MIYHVKKPKQVHAIPAIYYPQNLFYRMHYSNDYRYSCDFHITQTPEDALAEDSQNVYDEFKSLTDFASNVLSLHVDTDVDHRYHAKDYWEKIMHVSEAALKDMTPPKDEEELSEEDYSHQTQEVQADLHPEEEEKKLKEEAEGAEGAEDARDFWDNVVEFTDEDGIFEECDESPETLEKLVNVVETQDSVIQEYYMDFVHKYGGCFNSSAKLEEALEFDHRPETKTWLYALPKIDDALEAYTHSLDDIETLETVQVNTEENEQPKQEAHAGHHELPSSTVQA